MIKNILRTSIFIGISFFFSSCGVGDNAYDKTNLIGSNYTSTQTQENALSSLQKNIFVVHSKKLVSKINKIKDTISKLEVNVTSNSIDNLKDDFLYIMREWKSVEASYIAVDYDDDLIDIPQLMDFFHTGKRLNVADDIDIALSQKGNISDYMYKNSSKSIVALEYLIFGDANSSDELATLLNERKKDALKLVVDNLLKQSSLIYDFYNQDKKFISNATDASNSMVNVLIDSSFKLKEWRVGEASGIAIKYKNNPNSSRFEYSKSKLSLDAIKTILTTHQEIMGVQSYPNFGSFASDNGALIVVTLIRSELKNALTIVNSFNVPIEDLVTSTNVDKKVENLYNSVKNLQALYYESLVSSLNLTAEIIEADGD